MIQDTIEKLKVLQDILSQKFTIEREIDELPRTLATKRELVSRLKKSFVEKNERYEETRRRVVELRIRLQEAESDREKYEGQMDQISTAREYDALDKEIRDAAEREQNYRRELQREEKELEEQKVRLEREETLIKAQEQELDQERARIDDETGERRQTLHQLKEREAETVPGLDPELLFKFERIIKSKAGEGIVSIKSGVCTGCQMILPNQFVNDVRQGEKILFCPYCSKIVFYTESTDEGRPIGFIDSDSEGLADLVDDDEFDDDPFEDEDVADFDEESDELDDEEDADEDEEDADEDEELDEDEDLLDEDEDESLDEEEDDFGDEEELDE